MDSCECKGGKSQEGEEKKREDQRGETMKRKKMQVREKVGKSRFTVFFQCGSRWSNSSLAKAAGAEPSGQMRDEYLHAVVPRSTSKYTKHFSFGVLLDVATLKKCTRLCREAHSKSKCTKHLSFGHF